MDNSAQKPTIQEVSYTHDALIDEILLNPAVSQGEMARMYGYTQGWMSIIVNSDAFQNRLAERKAELVDPKIRASIQERLDAVARVALERIMDRLDNPISAIKNGDLIAMAKLGVGDKNNRLVGPTTQNNLYVVALPAPAQNTQEWLDNRSDKSHLRAPMEVIRTRVEALTTRPLPIAEEVLRG